MVQLSAHHVGVVVSDLEESASFYRDTLGFDVVAEFSLSGPGIARGVDVADVEADFVHLDAEGTLIELTEYTPAGTETTPDAINQIGAIHIGLEVADIDEFYAQLPDRISPLSPPQTVDTGAEILFFEDPDGNFLEIVEE